MKIPFPKSIHYRKPIPESRADELLSVRWFSGVIEQSNPIFALSDEWSDFRLDRRNEITSLLSQRLKNRGSEWNKCAQVFGEFFDSHISADVLAGIRSAHLPEELMSVVRFDILSYMQEINYSDVSRFSFFHRLWELYKLGRLPCGWEGVYPDGKLVFQ